jgi:hypothetical protein
MSARGLCIYHIVEKIDTVDELWWVIRAWLGDRANNEARRESMRRLLRRRLLHREMGANPQAAPPPPPPSTGNCSANRAPRMCCRCGSPRGAHDIDGQHNGCDGFVAAK